MLHSSFENTLLDYSNPRAYASRSLRLRTKAAAKAVTGRAMTQTSTPVSPVAGVPAPLSSGRRLSLVLRQSSRNGFCGEAD